MLETMEMIIKVKQNQAFRTDYDIGSYSIGLSTLYRKENRELYKTWLQISDPKSPLSLTGYL